jgi:outer membrane protein assembly factor BamA
MMRSSRWLAVLLLWGIGLPWGESQSSGKSFDHLPAADRQLLSVKVSGTKRYSDEAVIAASGLQMGTTVVEDDFKKAARRLGDLGVFTDITYSYSYSSAGTKLALQVTDVEKFVPVRFEDFVWFSDQELLQRIKERAPMFNGEVPFSGNLADRVSDVLQALLVENAIPGNVEYERVGKANGPIDSIVYHVSQVLIQIRNVEFTGAGEAELPALKAAAQRVFETEYSRGVLNALVEHQLLPVYYTRGYLKAAFGVPQPNVVKKPSANSDDGGPRNLTIVDVTFSVTPGVQYKIKALQWSGNKEFSTDVLQKMVRAQPGDVANTVRIGDNLKDIQKLYGSRGYVTASIKVDAEFDDAGTALIHLNVKEGYEYHMGELEFRGLDNSLTAKLRNAWKLRPGDVFDSTYLSEYLPAAHKLLPSGLDWDVSPHVTANARDKTVDVDLIYSVKAPK